MWDKTDVENLIYARAAAEKKTLWSAGGCLHCSNASPPLAALLGIYNRFFAAGNKRWLAGETALINRAARAEYHCFLQERLLKPLLPAACLTLKNPLRGRGFKQDKMFCFYQ